MEKEEALNILRLSYDNVHLLKNTDMAIVGLYNKDKNITTYGLYDIANSRVVLPLDYSEYKHLGCVVQFNVEKKAKSNSIIYGVYNNKITDVVGGIYSTRVSGALKILITNNQKVIIVKRNNSEVAYNDKFHRIIYPNNTFTKVGCVLETEKEILVFMLNGHLHTLESYLKETYKEVYYGDHLVAGKYIALDRSLYVEVLDYTGLPVNNSGIKKKINDISALRKLRRYV